MGLRGDFLHLGAGGEPLPDWAEGVKETRLDIDPQWEPDYVASITDIGYVGKYDFVYSSHCLEHVSLHEAKLALLEMKRVLVDGGTNIAIVPDLEGISATHDIVYDSAAGPICGLDMIYGPSWLLKKYPYMSHKYGYTLDTLKGEFEEAGFKNITGTTIKNIHSIMVTGEK